MIHNSMKIAYIHQKRIYSCLNLSSILYSEMIISRRKRAICLKTVHSNLLLRVQTTSVDVFWVQVLKGQKHFLSRFCLCSLQFPYYSQNSAEFPCLHCSLLQHSTWKRYVYFPSFHFLKSCYILPLSNSFFTFAKSMFWAGLKTSRFQVFERAQSVGMKIVPRT